jgi:hypothetical protein
MPAVVRRLAAYRSKALLTRETGPDVQTITKITIVIGLANPGTDTLA